MNIQPYSLKVNTSATKDINEVKYENGHSIVTLNDGTKLDLGFEQNLPYPNAIVSVVNKNGKYTVKYLDGSTKTVSGFIGGGTGDPGCPVTPYEPTSPHDPWEAPSPLPYPDEPHTATPDMPYLE